MNWTNAIFIFRYLRLNYFGLAYARFMRVWSPKHYISFDVNKVVFE